jgi:hypothetical protein
MMTPSMLLSSQDWAQHTFGSVRLADQRTNERAVRIAQAMAEQPAASLPKQMHSRAALKATYRFLQAASGEL